MLTHIQEAINSEKKTFDKKHNMRSHNDANEFNNLKRLKHSDVL